MGKWGVDKSRDEKGVWVAQEIEPLALDLSSGPDLEFKPRIRLGNKLKQ